VSAQFHVAETELLASLVGQLLDLVHGDMDDSPVRPPEDPLAAAIGFSFADRPTDPVLLRLFPDGYQDDDEAAADFRRFTETSLRETKSNAAATVLASLATAEGARPDGDADAEVTQGEKIRIDLDKEQATAWLRTLTDLRLALGTRLGVEEGDEEHWGKLPSDDPRRHVHDVYDWLGWVQETLVRALSL